MIKIEIEAGSRYPFERDLVRKEVKRLLKEHNIEEKAWMSVSVVGKRKMKKLNQKHMGKEGVTDVLSFPLTQSGESGEFIDSPDEVLRLGDVVVCYPVAVEQALKEQRKLDEVLVDLIKHGTLHLLGIHHE